MSIAVVIGTRPEIVQAFPLASAGARRGLDLRIVAVSQHTDPLMTTEVLPEQFTRRWQLERVTLDPFDLAHATAAVGQYFSGRRPDSVLVIGDTDTALAGALAASEHRIPVGHVEAGLRSHDWAMKEERNRTLIDHLADVLFPPTAAATAQLIAEQVHGRVVGSGDVHVDAFRLLSESGLVGGSPAASDGYLCTLHRRENILDPGRLAHLIGLLETADRPVRFLVHPHTRQRLAGAGLLDRLEQSPVVELCDPMPFLPFVQAMVRSSGIVTDSGGVQKQAYLLGVPCLTLRTTTEWHETLVDGWNVLLDPASVDALPPVVRPAVGVASNRQFGDGHAADAILEAMVDIRR